MANFRAYPGLFVKVSNTVDTVNGTVKAGQVVQIMYIRYNVAFVGVPGCFSPSSLGLVPLYTQEAIDQALKEGGLNG